MSSPGNVATAIHGELARDGEDVTVERLRFLSEMVRNNHRLLTNVGVMLSERGDYAAAHGVLKDARDQARSWFEIHPDDTEVVNELTALENDIAQLEERL